MLTVYHNQALFFISYHYKCSAILNLFKVTFLSFKVYHYQCYVVDLILYIISLAFDTLAFIHNSITFEFHQLFKPLAIRYVHLI